MKTPVRFLSLVVPLLLPALSSSLSTHAQGTAFTYQGFLTAQGAPANGSFDLQFAVYDAAGGGLQQGATVQTNSVGITNGLFTLIIDPGANVFSGAARWLDIAVRPAGGAAFTNVMPRQPFTATPYAVFAANASTAASASSVPGLAVNTNLSAVALGTGNSASASSASVGGGNANTASATYAAVGGGYFNTASGERAVVAGGYANTASGYAAFLGGGVGNQVSGNYATLGGGDNNVASGGGAFVGGGSANQATNLFATVPGGENNLAGGQYSFAAGQRAKALHDGAFVWADSQAADFGSSATNQFLIRAAGGVGIGTVSPDKPLSIRGVRSNGEWLSFKNTNDISIWHLNNLQDGLNFVQTGVADARLFLSTNGNVGIGTNSPTAKLDVAGTVKAAAFVGNGAGLTNLSNRVYFVFKVLRGTSTFGSVRYYYPEGQNAVNGTATEALYRLPVGGTLSGFSVETDITGYSSRTFYVRVGNLSSTATTALQIGMNGSATTGSSAGSVAVSAGQFFTIEDIQFTEQSVTGTFYFTLRYDY